MKTLYMAGIMALTFGLSANAYAKDLNAIDVLVGDFSAVGSFDIPKLAANDMLSAAFDQNEASFGKEYAALKEVGIDVKKDISLAVVAINDKGHSCSAIDAKKDISESMAKLAVKDNLTVSEYKGIQVYSDKDASVAVLSATRVVVCDSKLDIKPSIDNALAASPKSLKDRNSTLHSMYNMTSSSADIRLAGKMSSSMRKSVASYKLDGEEGQVFKVEDIDAGAISVSFAKGLDIQAVAKTKSDDVAKQGAVLISKSLNDILGDPSLKELGLDFLSKAVTIKADKKNLKGSVKLSNEQMAMIVGLATMMAGSK